MAASKEEVIELLRQRMEELCQQLLPGGRREGRKWVCGNVHGDAGRSMHVELQGPKTGMWHDFAADDGGDVLKLIEKNRGLIDYRAVMDWARDWLGLEPWSPDPNAPKPFDPLSKTWKGLRGSTYWPYRDADGHIIAYVVRFDRVKDDGTTVKDTIPMRLVNGEWTWKGWRGEARPIYGIEVLKRRPNAPLLIVEGEKTKEAAARLFPERVALTWQGGSKSVNKADWQPIIDHIVANELTPGFDVVIWPDADEPGLKAAKYLMTLLPGQPKVVDTSVLPEGWDLYDEPPAEVDIQALLDAAKYKIPKPTPRTKGRREDTLVHTEIQLRGEVPKPVDMELPVGVEWEAVRDDVIDYNLFFHNRVCYSKRTITDKSGNVLKEYFHAITNFEIRILQHLEDEKGSLYVIRITNTDGRTRTFHCPTEVMLSATSLRKAMLDRGNYRYHGSDRDDDFQRLTAKLLQEMEDGVKIEVLGWQEEYRVYAMNNALITTTGEVLELDDMGSVQLNGLTVYVPSANKIFAKIPSRYVPQKRFRLVQSGLNFNTIAAQICTVHKHHGQIALVFGVMAVFSSKIYTYHRFVPMCFLYGEPGSGKSKLTQAIQLLFGDPQEAMTITGKSTDKAKIRKFAQFVDGLVVLEEYSNVIGDPGIQWLKGLNDRLGYERGNIDSPYGTDNVPITSAVILTGNDYPQNEALLSRFIVIEMMQNTFTDAEAKRMSVLLDMMEEGYSGVLRELIAHRDEFDNEYKDHYRAALKEMTEALKDAGVTMERLIQNCAILMGVYRFFASRLKWPMDRDTFRTTLVNAMAAQVEQRKDGGDVANWWSCFLAAVRAEELVLGDDYLVKGDELAIRFNEAHTRYMVHHRQLFGTVGYPSATIRTKLVHSPAFTAHKKNMKGFAGYESGTSTYCFSLNRLGPDFSASLLSCERLSGQDL